MWSLGVCFWEIFEYGKVPYAALSNEETVTYVLHGNRLECPAACPEELYKVMLQCWSSVAKERPELKYINEQLAQLKIRQK